MLGLAFVFIFINWGRVIPTPFQPQIRELRYLGIYVKVYFFVFCSVL